MIFLKGRIQGMYNYILVTSILGWCIAQFIKTVINLIKYRKFSVERLFGAGGWPSAHSAMVCSAATAVFRVEGGQSTIFAVTCIFTLITMYDAMGVRRAAGQHAKEINRINRVVENIEQNEIPALFSGNSPEDAVNSVERQFVVLKELLGHTPFEVASGALLGIALAFIMPMNIV